MLVSRKNKTLKKSLKSSKYSKLSKNGNRKTKKNVRKMKGGGVGKEKYIGCKVLEFPVIY